MKKNVSLFLLLSLFLNLFSPLFAADVAKVEKIIDQDTKKAQEQAPKPIKFLNAKYLNVTVVIEGPDGKPIGNNWSISRNQISQKPQPLIYNGERILLSPERKIKIFTSTGFELQRYGFELDVDPEDSSYIWVLK
ncbi:MAG: hypothetical protein HY094_03805 [Candidatus Melainabacteria bacterium]|nr:hypothetical protein [Candidatus Melainabacteria bacterium]